MIISNLIVPLKKITRTVQTMFVLIKPVQSDHAVILASENDFE